MDMKMLRKWCLFIAILAYSLIFVSALSPYNDRRDTTTSYRRRSLGAINQKQTTEKRPAEFQGTSKNQRDKNGDKVGIIIHVARRKPAGKQYIHSEEYAKMVPHYLLPNLRIAGRFRDGVVYMLGYMLQSPTSQLTDYQYTSLELIYKVIKKNQLQMYNMLPILAELKGKSRSSQFRRLMVELLKFLPGHLISSAKYLISQFDNNLMKVNELHGSLPRTSDFLTDISDKAIIRAKIKNPRDELSGYDKSSRITEAVLGRVFVKLFKLLNAREFVLSQEFFSTILVNLPNRDGDPIFQEYVRYIAEIAWSKEIPNWNRIKQNLNNEDPYTLISSVTDKMCGESAVPFDLKQAMAYIKDHFLASKDENLLQIAHDANLITKNGINMESLISLISPVEFGNNALKLKAKLIKYIASNGDEVSKALVGMNRFGYVKPKDVLMAFLSRLRMRLPPHHKEFRKVVTALLSILTLKRRAWNVSQPTGTITLWTLFDSIDQSEVSEETLKLAKLLLDNLTKNPKTWNAVRSIRLPDQGECATPQLCFHAMLKRVENFLLHNPSLKEELTRIRLLIDHIHKDIERNANKVGPQKACDNNIEDHYMSDEGIPDPIIDPTSKIIRDPKKPVLPVLLDPTNPIVLKVSKSGEVNVFSPKMVTANPVLRGSVTLPSVICLQQSSGLLNSPGDCERYIEEPIIKSLKRIIGPDYIHKILGDNWQARYPTKICALIELLKNAVKNPLLAKQGVLLNKIVDYMIALEFIAPYVFLPLITDHQNLDTQVIWSTFDSGHPSKSILRSAPPEAMDYENTWPLVNPINLLQPVNERRPFSDLLPKFSADSPYKKKLQPLTELFKTQNVYPLFAKCWNPGEYPNKQALLISVLRQLLTQKFVQADSRLYKLVNDYLDAFELPSLSMQTPQNYIEKMIRQYDESQPTQHLVNKINGESDELACKCNVTIPKCIPQSTNLIRPPRVELKKIIKSKVSRLNIFPSSYNKKTPVIFSRVQPDDDSDEKPVIDSSLSVNVLNSSKTISLSSNKSGGVSENPEMDVYKIVHENHTIGGIHDANSSLGDINDELKLNNKSAYQDEESVDYEEYDDESIPNPFSKINTSLPDSALPLGTNTEEPIILRISKSRESILYFPNTSKGVSEDKVTLPSVVCLQQSSENFQDTCKKDFESNITMNLKEILGPKHIEKTLGDGWQVRYPTMISVLVALLKSAGTKGATSAIQEELLKTINQYRGAFEYIAPYVLLPLITDHQKLDTHVIWSTYDLKNPVKSKLTSKPPEGLVAHENTVPIVNPKIMLQPVNKRRPFSGLLPILPADSPYEKKIRPLVLQFKTGKIRTLLGKDWNPLMYPNKQALLISALQDLLSRENVKSNSELYEQVKNYLNAIKLPSLYLLSIDRPQADINEHFHDNETIESIHDANSSPSDINDELISCNIPAAKSNEESVDYEESYDESTPNPFSKINTSSLDSVLPSGVNPKDPIIVRILKSGESILLFSNTSKGVSEDTVTLPSVVCLQQSSASENFQDTCEKDIEDHITMNLKEILGPKYIEKTLGDDWQARHPTKISVLVALLKSAGKKEATCARQGELLKRINQYRRAFEFVAPYILLPLITDHQKLDTHVIWSTYDTKNPVKSKLTSKPPEDLVAYENTVPMVNPKIMLQPVNKRRPFSDLLPMLPADSPYEKKIRPLVLQFKTGKIRTLLGKDWNPLMHPNKQALLISALRKLLSSENVQSNPELYEQVKNYLNAIELSSLYLPSIDHPQAHVNENFDDNQTSGNTDEAYDSLEIMNNEPNSSEISSKIIADLKDTAFPPLLDPTMSILVKLGQKGPPDVETSKSAITSPAQNTIILPSVSCLQQVPDPNNIEGKCHVPWLSRLKELLGPNYVETLLGHKWVERHPKMISFLVSLLKHAAKNEKVVTQPDFLNEIDKQMEAYKFVGPYIFLPLIVHFQKFKTPVVWLTYNSAIPEKSHISRFPTPIDDTSTVSYPIVNPKIWLQNVDDQHPYSIFFPELPENDPHYRKLRPLTRLITSGKIRKILGCSWNPSEYPNRGALFISVLRKLVNHKSVKSDIKLYPLVQNLVKAIELTSTYVDIPQSNMSSLIEESEGAWTVSLVDLVKALPSPKNNKEVEHLQTLRLWLTKDDLLNELDIPLPSLTTSNDALLTQIINTALSSGKVNLDRKVRAALKYYKNRVLTSGSAHGNIVWNWIQVMKITLDIGSIFTACVPYETSPYNVQYAYNSLMTYLNENTKFLAIENLLSKHYPTYDVFLRAYLDHLLHQPDIDEKEKENMKLLKPHIVNTGSCKTPMPEWTTEDII